MNYFEQKLEEKRIKQKRYQSEYRNRQKIEKQEIENELDRLRKYIVEIEKKHKEEIDNLNKELSILKYNLMTGENVFQTVKVLNPEVFNYMLKIHEDIKKKEGTVPKISIK